MKSLHLLDGSAFAYRSFFALPPLSTSEGFPTNAVFGFFRMLFSLLKKERPKYLAVVFDAPAKTRRERVYERYKAQRPKMPDPLKAQIPVIKELLRLSGIPLLEEAGYEADDLIGALALRGAEEGFFVKVYSPDKDLLQLVSERVVVVNPMSGEVFTERKVREKFGVPPQKLADYLALVGDKTDNVPGLKGVGPKKALKLLEHFGSVEEMLKRWEEVKKEVPGAQREELELSYLLVKLSAEAPVPPVESLVPSTPDFNALTKRLRELEMKSLLTEAKRVLSGGGQASLF